MTYILTLKPGRERALLRRHPWMFSGAGDTVDVHDSRGRAIARGFYSPESQIRVRVATWNLGEPITPEFFRARLAAALELRTSVFDANIASSGAQRSRDAGRLRASTGGAQRQSGLLVTFSCSVPPCSRRSLPEPPWMQEAPSISCGTSNRVLIIRWR